MQAYRALEHGFAKKQCERQSRIVLFPSEIQKLATKFVHLQAKRHEADYNSFSFFTKSEVIQEIDETEQVLKAFDKASSKDKRAFAVYVLLLNR